MRTVLLAGAQARNLNFLRNRLTADGLGVYLALSGAQVWQVVMRQPVDAIVLHAGGAGPDFDPWHLIQELAAADHLPLIVLARPAPSTDRVRAYRCGARYCLTLPASAAELVACIEAVLGDTRSRAPAPHPDEAVEYADGELRIDIANREIQRDGLTYSITSRESPLLERLVKNAGRATPSAELCKSVWGPKAWPGKRHLLKTYIAQLRRKVESDSRHPRYIISRRGLGYAFMPRASVT